MKELHIRWPYGNIKCFTISYDDGFNGDIQLIELMKEYGIKGTFNLNSGSYKSERIDCGNHQFKPAISEIKDIYNNKNCEVAIHSLTHSYLHEIPLPLCVKEIIEDRLNFEKQFKTIIRGMAYPYGVYNKDIKDILSKCGIAYSRTVNNSHSFKIPTDWLELNPTCHHDDEHLLALADEFLNFTATKYLEKDPALFYVWGHTFEFNRNNNWFVIEDLFNKVGRRDDVWYATNIEVYDYVKAFNNLIFSADADMVYNPTSTEIWFSYDNLSPIKIAPNETLDLSKQ